MGVGKTNLRSKLTLAQILRHQPIFQITESSTLLEVVLGQEHIPQTQTLGLDFQLLNHGGGGLPSFLAFA